VGLSLPLTLPHFPPLVRVLGGSGSLHAALTLTLAAVLSLPLCPLADRERLVRACFPLGVDGCNSLPILGNWHSFIHSFIHTYFPFLFTAKNSRLRKRLSLEFEQTGRVTWIVVPPPCQSIFSPHLCQIENVLPSGAGRKSTLIEGKVKVKGKKEFTCRPIGRATLALDRGRIWYGTLFQAQIEHTPTVMSLVSIMGSLGAELG